MAASFASTYFEIHLISEPRWRPVESCTVLGMVSRAAHYIPYIIISSSHDTVSWLDHVLSTTSGHSLFSSFFFFRKNYLLLSCATSVRPSVEIISFRGNSLSNRPIELKIGLNVREGVVHVRKA